VENVLDILRGGIDSALLGLGKANIRDLTPDDIVVPPGFTRALGGDGPVFDPALNGQAAAGVPGHPGRSGDGPAGSPEGTW
jgi:hypothetical protein